MINKKGLSLLEVLTAVAILVIISLITYASLKDYNRNQVLKNETKTVVSHLKLAQQYCVTEQVKYALRVNILASDYNIIKKGEPDEIVGSFLMSEDVYFSSTSGLLDNEAVYNPTGAVDYSGEIFLTHQQTGNQTKINIRPSGYITWEYVD